MASDPGNTMGVVTPRILSLDHTLRDQRVRNTTFSSAITLLQFEIAVFDPGSILGGYRTGSRYNNAISLTRDSSVAFLNDHKRRLAEFEDFLSLGRMLVIFVPPPTRWYYETGETRNEGTAAKPRLRTVVDEVKVTEVLPVPLDLVRAQGEEFDLAVGPPFASLWRAAGEQFYFDAYLREPVGQTLLTMAGTDRSVAALVRSQGGLVLYMPRLGEFWPDEDAIEVDERDPSFEDKYEAATESLQREYHGQLIDALLELYKQLLGGDEELPEWTEQYRLPGEQEAIQTTADAQNNVSKAQSALEDAQRRLLLLQRQKLLVTGTGKELEDRVHEALVELGCTVEAGNHGRTDRVVRWAERVAVLEVKGLTKSARESDAAQLEKWVSEYIQEHGVAPKAILAMSAWREVPLAERDQPAFPDQMLGYAVARQHCLIETGQILAAVVTCKSNNSKRAFLTRLFEAVGVVDDYGWEAALTPVERGPASRGS